MSLNIHKGLTPDILQSPVKLYSGQVEMAFHIHTTIEKLLKYLRNKKTSDEIFYFYAVDEERKLYGVVPTRDILFAQPEKRLIDIVQEDIITIYEGVSVEHALKILTEHQLLSIPIVDEEYRLVGLFEVKPGDLYFSNQFKKTPKKALEDIFQIIGFSIEKSKLESTWTEYRYRFPWLIGNLIAGFICAGIASYYQLTLSKVIILSMFIPLILTLAESISMQSMAISLQFLHNKKFYFKEVLNRILHECGVAILLGLTSAFLLCVYYWIGFESEGFFDLTMIVIASSIFTSMVIAAFFGTFFPIILNKLALDPKIAAGPVVLMATDIMTTGFYLWLAAKILG